MTTASEPVKRKAGRPRIEDRTKRKTNRDVKDAELLMVLRKIRPHVAESILTAAHIMKSEHAKEENKLRAATLILDHYKKLVIDLYGQDDIDDETEPTEVQPNNAPVFSLTVVKEATKEG